MRSYNFLLIALFGPFLSDAFILKPAISRRDTGASIHHSPIPFTANEKPTLVLSVSDSSEDEITSITSDTGDFSFFDEASIYVRAGSGGQGASTYKKAKKGQNGIPDGGSGGKGGNVVLTADPSLNTLAGLSRRTLRPNAFGGGGAAASSKRTGHGGMQGGDVFERLYSYRAEDGWTGGRMYDNGRCGEDFEVRVPPGTVVSIEVPRVAAENDEANNTNDEVSQTVANEENKEGDDVMQKVRYDLIEIGAVSYDNPALLVARGGAGGEGTATLKGKKKGATRNGPEGGERHRLKLTLKIVADIALVGVPNAGKSTFLAAVTRAKPRIADYPFTTVVPNLGTWIPPYDAEESTAGSAGLVLCDVPGLIAGASEGVGLGHAFLRHIERCRVILHLIDATGEDPIGDFEMVNEEIRKYGSGSLANKPQVVVVNKIDAAWDSENHEMMKAELSDKLKKVMLHTRVMWISAKEKDGVDDLMARMSSYVNNVKEQN
eukprot:CAMPEP_0194242036 /NCGR_PEP_ID=MMETSP0158-20130606/7694_1 /TAXON_ID=33649 /ORGANISM="Thalassionema nitzschioides, Strain L26-B" /LENGTH=489 /DNA_ID=CAMNT_0038977045 /DNA_START=151 /DNA_END=1617 /DNA_ORIENTATION=+